MVRSRPTHCEEENTTVRDLFVDSSSTSIHCPGLYRTLRPELLEQWSWEVVTFIRTVNKFHPQTQGRLYPENLLGR